VIVLCISIFSVFKGFMRVLMWFKNWCWGFICYSISQPSIMFSYKAQVDDNMEDDTVSLPHQQSFSSLKTDSDYIYQVRDTCLLLILNLYHGMIMMSLKLQLPLWVLWMPSFSDNTSESKIFCHLLVARLFVDFCLQKL
jgi:hypothetical protein